MSAKFKTIKVNTNTTVGECFKKRREENNVSLKDVSEKLKIKRSYLEDLEENNYNQLPPDVYVKGFIRAYAALVGFNAEKMVELFSKERTVNNKVINKNNSKEKIYKHSKFSISEYLTITPRLITVLITLFLLSVVGYYLWHQISSFSSTPYLVVSNPIVDQISKESEILIAGQIEKDATLKINGKGVYVNFEGYFQETIILKPGNNVLVIEATNRFGKVASETRNIVYEKKLDDFIPSEFEIREDEIVEEKNIFQKEDLDFEGEIEFIGP
ncbi:MAG: helix-turn-helix domain-containing protein [Candidatus Pacebacteria bacterium]|nr:helix-turn-helix domain-containing protein [Candidatus Paceibacterota bacterium]